MMSCLWEEQQAKHTPNGDIMVADSPSRPSLLKQAWELDPKKLVVKQFIARGNFASIYTGLYDGHDGVVAVKVLGWGAEHICETTVRSTFEQEVSIWHQLNHPNISCFIGATMGTQEIGFLSFPYICDQLDIPSNSSFIVTEYCAGGTLKSYLKRHRIEKIPFPTVIKLALGLARGLCYLHSQNVVHRDIKTENLLLDKNLNIKIAEFGVSRIEALDPREMTGNTGTLSYMAPEVIQSRPYDRKCDVYSFGICLWEIYCCDVAYGQLLPNFRELTRKIVYKKLRPKIPRCCPSSLAKVMRACWAAEPSRRPEMKQVVSMIEAVDTSEVGSTTNLDRPHGCFCWKP